MRLILAIIAALAVIALILFGLYRCGPLDSSSASDADASTKMVDGLGGRDARETNPDKAAIYDDVDLVALPNYATVRLPAAQRQQLAADAEVYIDELIEPKSKAVDVSAAAEFVGGEQTIMVEGVAVTVNELFDPKVRAQLIAHKNNQANNDGSNGVTPTISSESGQNLTANGGETSGTGSASMGTELGTQRGGQRTGQRNIQGDNQQAAGKQNLGKKRQSLYYVHTVVPTDEQGIWGIVQAGLKEKFANGLAVKREEQEQVYRVVIPDTADERVGNDSSFLGRVLHQKVRESMVYNRQNGKLGRNPDVIFPGQQLVIVEFKREELLSIYEYFITQPQ